MTEAHACEQLDQGFYLEADRLNLIQTPFGLRYATQASLSNNVAVIIAYTHDPVYSPGAALAANVFARSVIDVRSACQFLSSH